MQMYLYIYIRMCTYLYIYIFIYRCVDLYAYVHVTVSWLQHICGFLQVRRAHANLNVSSRPRSKKRTSGVSSHLVPNACLRTSCYAKHNPYPFQILFIPGSTSHRNNVPICIILFHFLSFLSDLSSSFNCKRCALPTRRRVGPGVSHGAKSQCGTGPKASFRHAGWGGPAPAWAGARKRGRTRLLRKDSVGAACARHISVAIRLGIMSADIVRRVGYLLENKELTPPPLPPPPPDVNYIGFFWGGRGGGPPRTARQFD